MKISIRKLKPEDTIAAERLVMRTYNNLLKQHGMEPIPYKPTRKQNRFYCHILKTDPTLQYAAFANDKLIAYASAMIRDGHWYLAHLFTDQKMQAKGLGAKLLKKVMKIPEGEEVHTRSLCTFAFNHYAVQLYTRFGMYAHTLLPFYSLKRDKKKKIRNIKNEYKFKVESITDYQQIEILNRLDKKNRMIYRPEDHKFWIDNELIKGYIFYLNRKVVGYSMTTRDTIIAPVSVTESRYLLPCLTEAINILLSTETESDSISLWAQGDNGPLQDFLLQHGFKISENELLMTDRMFGRPECYIPALLALY